MKGFTQAFSVLFMTVLGGLLVILIQENYLKPPSYNGLRATAISGPWAPRHTAAPGKVVSVESDWELLKGNNSIVRITIENEGPKTIEQGRIRVKKNFGLPDALVTDPIKKEGVFLKRADDIPLPRLAPGGSATVFLWNQFGFGWPNFLDDLHIYSELGKLPVSLSSHVDASGYGDEDRTLNAWETFKAHWWWMIPVLGIILAVITFVSDYIWSKYIRKLLLDDDFWLSERQRIETCGYKKFVPKVSDLDINPGILAKLESPSSQTV